MRIISISAAGIAPSSAMHSAQSSTGMAVSSSCKCSLARSGCQGSMGRDCISQRLLPSSETDGVSILFIVAIRQIAVHSSTVVQPSFAPKKAFIMSNHSFPRTRSSTPHTGRNSMPMPQLSI